jgi:hypothetical protein
MHYNDEEILEKIKNFILNDASEEELGFICQENSNSQTEKRTPDLLFQDIQDNFDHYDIVNFVNLYLDISITFESEEELYVID